MRHLLMLFGILMCFCFASQIAKACTCAGSGSPCEGYGTAAAVFVGTTVSVREKERPKDIATARKQDDWPEGSRFYKFSVKRILPTA